MSYELSILIPARNEMFLARTIQDILENKTGSTGIIVGLDGQLSEPPIASHPDITIVYMSQSIGQRAMTNRLCRLSKAKYVMKVDAHCAFAKGFDTTLMADMQDNWTVAPTMRNLHVFDWVCPQGHRRYQGPSGPCEVCGEATERDIVWNPKQSPESTAYRFNKDLEFKYWGEYKARQQGDIVDSLSLQGSCFMMTREKYWELNICDENWGSWGGQGAEVALKTWLSGGEVKINKKTWYAHLFRTQGGDFGFPYPNPGNEQKKAKDSLRDTFLNDKWPLAKIKLNDLLEKFAPVPDWHDTTVRENRTVGKPKKGVVYYTDSELDESIAELVRRQILKGIKEKHIVSVSLKSLNFGNNIALFLERGHLTMAKQILAGLEASDADVIFFCEHDVLYHPKHFDFIPPDRNKVYYNVNVWKVRSDGHAVKVDDCRQLSGLVAYRDVLIKHFQERVKRIQEQGYSNAIGFEPGTHNREERIDDLKSDIYSAEFPNVDIRHDSNLTPTKWSPDEFRNKKYAEGWTESHVTELDGWPFTESDFRKILQSI